MTDPDASESPKNVQVWWDEDGDTQMWDGPSPQDRLRAVLDLHHEGEAGDGNCAECLRQEYPCATARACGVPIPKDAL